MKFIKGENLFFDGGRVYLLKEGNDFEEGQAILDTSNFTIKVAKDHNVKDKGNYRAVFALSDN